MLGRTVGLAAAVGLPAAAPAHAAKIEKLSRPGKTSYFAFVDKAETARAQPKASARAVTKLTLKSPEGTDDLVMVLDRTVVQKKTWLRVRLPIRPNGTTGWVPANALSDLQPVHAWLRINTKAFRVTLVKDSKTVFSARVGVGQPQWPTPRGQFFIRAKLEKFSGAGSVY